MPGAPSSVLAPSSKVWAVVRLIQQIRHLHNCVGLESFVL